MICRKLYYLKQAIPNTRSSGITPTELYRFIDSIDPLLGLQDDQLPAYMFTYPPSLEASTSAIVERRTGDGPYPQAFNPVAVSFFVQSYSQAKNVQGLLGSRNPESRWER